MSLVSVMIDSREPDYIQKLTFGGAPTLVSALPAGDLLVACDDGALLAIERKTSGDFLNTLRDERLFEQLRKLREQSEWAYLIICGCLQPGPAGKCFENGRETGWNWASVSGALLTVQEAGVHILEIGGDHEYENAITRLANRDRQNLRVRPARDLTIVSEAEVILSSLPGIGAERVQAILKECGRVAEAIWWLTDDRNESTSVPGIGLKTKQRVRAALGLEWDECLGIYLRQNNDADRVERER